MNVSGIRWRAVVRIEGLVLAGAPNRRELPGQRQARVAKEREAMTAAWGRAGRPKPPQFPALVVFERQTRGHLDDDNLPTAFKSLRDELAELWGLRSDAASTPVLWRYTQVRAPEQQVLCFIGAPILVEVCAHCGRKLAAGLETCPKEIYQR